MIPKPTTLYGYIQSISEHEQRNGYTVGLKLDQSRLELFLGGGMQAIEGLFVRMPVRVTVDWNAPFEMVEWTDAAGSNTAAPLGRKPKPVSKSLSKKFR